MNTTFKTALISLVCIWIVLMAAAACRGEPGASRDVQIHRPYTGIPRPGPIPVALGHPLRTAFSILSTDPR